MLPASVLGTYLPSYLRTWRMTLLSLMSAITRISFVSRGHPKYRECLNGVRVARVRPHHPWRGACRE